MKESQNFQVHKHGSMKISIKGRRNNTEGKGDLKWTLGITQTASLSFYKRKNIVS